MTDETPEQAKRGEQAELILPPNIEEAPAEAPSEVTAEVSRTHESWPHDDVRKLVRVGDQLMRRGVGMLLLCRRCEQTLKLEGRDGGGASLMGCGCCVRRWL